MILLAVSTATFAAGDDGVVGCRCHSSEQVVVALDADDRVTFVPRERIVAERPAEAFPSMNSDRFAGRPALGSSLDNLSVALNNKQTDPAAFTWQPLVPERRWIYLVIHHSATNSGSVDSIHRSHRQRKDAAGNPWLGIGYHFVIGNGSGMEDGEIESTFRWRQQIHGAHSGSTVHNANGIGICLIGNFQQDVPTQKQLDAVITLVDQLSHQYRIPGSLIIGHNTVKPTACPGKNFPLQDVIRKSVSEQRSAG